MKIAVIGTGLTGGTVVDILGDRAIPFNRGNPPTAEKLKEADIAIIFVPESAAEGIVDLLIETEKPAVWGTTGYEWPAELSDRVESAGTQWVIGSNFSLGMNLIRKTLDFLGRGSSMLSNPVYHIHEVHHVNKKDAPSGTALSWREWLGKEASITSGREGDVKGIHQLHIKTDVESIWLKHEAHDRAVFAEGAIWAAMYLLQHPDMEPGVYSFASLFDRAYGELV